jgi:uncharacterized protein YodC (DUF2158 family)
MGADFLTLFRRSRFSTRLGGPNMTTEEKKRGMEQCERFAAAMIAFGLTHDPIFRRQFLQKVCELENPPKDGWEVSVEEHAWC